MYRLYGIQTQNTFKALYTLEELGLDFEFKVMDLANKEHKSEAYLKVNPLGKVPALLHDDFGLFESGAIVRYLANANNSTLYPQQPQKRAQVDQWLDFFSAHLGRWLSTLYFEKVLKRLMNFGETNLATCEEAEGFSKQFLTNISQHLDEKSFFVGEQLSIADLSAFAYIEQMEALEMDMSQYANLKSWYDQLKTLPSIERAKARFKS